MELIFLIEGILIGVAFSAPVGPINIVCIQEAIRRGFSAGLAAGIGAVTADTLFAAIASYGTTAFTGTVLGWAHPLQLVGGALLIAFGWRILLSRPPQVGDGKLSSTSTFSTALAAFGLTFTNPVTVFGYIAVFGSLGSWAPDSGDYVGATILVAGVFTGGSLWWLGVATVVAFVRSSLSERTLKRINIGAGAILIAFGAAMILRLALILH
ncbi:MAG: LysE family transporter [Ancalomicrobiaceae bacterium]|nr:LysE family transporter [Ancalomicrobiaceae bacterium]